MTKAKKPTVKKEAKKVNKSSAKNVEKEIEPQSTNITALKGRLKGRGLVASIKRIKGEMYNITIRKENGKKTEHFTCAIQENATKAETDTIFRLACKELKV